MTSLHDARVEAAAKAIYDEWRSPDYFTWEKAVEGRNANPDPTYPHIVDKFRTQARAALAAADDVVTVEMIAEAFCAEMDDESFSGKPCAACLQGSDAILALLVAP